VPSAAMSLTVFGISLRHSGGPEERACPRHPIESHGALAIVENQHSRQPLLALSSWPAHRRSCFQPGGSSLASPSRHEVAETVAEVRVTTGL
jgi:hypothetical protein